MLETSRKLGNLAEFMNARKCAMQGTGLVTRGTGLVTRGTGLVTAQLTPPSVARVCCRSRTKISENEDHSPVWQTFDSFPVLCVCRSGASSPFYDTVRIIKVSVPNNITRMKNSRV